MSLQQVRVQLLNEETGEAIQDVDVLTSGESVLFEDGETVAHKLSHLTERLANAEQASNTQISDLIDQAPEALNTLGKLAGALDNKADFATTINEELALKATKTETETLLASKADVTTLASKADITVTDNLSEQINVLSSERGYTSDQSFSLDATEAVLNSITKSGKYSINYVGDDVIQAGWYTVNVTNYGEAFCTQSLIGFSNLTQDLAYYRSYNNGVWTTRKLVDTTVTDGLEDKVNWKPDNWKTESAVPSEYENSYVTIFHSGDMWNGVFVALIKTTRHNNWLCIQEIFHSELNGLKSYRTGYNDAWGEWQTIATTDITDAIEEKIDKKLFRISNVQEADYRKSVIALCILSNKNASTGTFTDGEISFNRGNYLGLTPNVFCRIGIGDLFELDYTPNVSIFKNSTAIKPCTFTYNGVVYGGIEFYLNNANSSSIYFSGNVSGFEIFGLDYYNISTQTAMNQEVYDSLNFDNIHYSSMSDNYYISNNKQISTTEKTEIAFPYTSEYVKSGSDDVVVKDSLNYIFISVGAKKADGSSIPSGVKIGDIPTGYRPSLIERTVVSMYSGALTSSLVGYGTLHIDNIGAVWLRYVGTLNVKEIHFNIGYYL